MTAMQPHTGTHSVPRLKWLSGVVIAFLMLQLALGATLHFHRLGEHTAFMGESVHTDFSHTQHADQSNFSPDQLVREHTTDLPLDAVAVDQPLLRSVPAATVVPGIDITRAPQPPPRYALPQPRGPPQAHA